MTHFTITEVSYHCPENVSSDYSMRIVLGTSDTAPMPELRHPIDQWWVRSGHTYRVRRLTGTEVARG